MILYNDFTTSLIKALDDIDNKWRNYEGLIVAGTHSPHDVEKIIEKIKETRETKLPYLGICAGHQYAAIEFARNVLGIKNATSEEFGSGTYVVKKLPILNVGVKNGESYWNNYEVIPEILEKWEKSDNFITCQFHPEYQSNKTFPHPLLVNFLSFCKKNI